MPSLKVVTYNIRLSAGNDGPNSWPFRAKALCQYVADLKADIIGVQEALPDQVEALKLALPEYRHIGVGREDGLSQGEHCSIYLHPNLTVMASGTFWFSDTPTIPNSRTWGNRITRITTWARVRKDDAEFLVTNSHLDHESDESRRRSVLQLQAFLSESAAPFLALGDFNMPPTSPNLKPLFVVATDALAGIGQGGKSTFHGWGPDEGTNQIDYIFASEAFALISAESPRVPHSDHYPVIAACDLLG